MKLSRISTAMLAACGTLASVSAFALPASSYTNTSETAGDTFNIRVSGATAQDNGLLGSALSYCTAGSLHRYQLTTNNIVYFCTPDIGTGPGQISLPVTSPAKTKLAIYKYGVGGSGSGVDPVNANSTLAFLDLAKLATAPACSGTNAATSTPDFDGAGPLATYVNVVCNTVATSGALATTATSPLLTTGAITYIGLSDVEPAFFTNNTANLASEPLSALIFGVPVTTNIRNALQAQQGLTVGNDLLANMPSLSRAQLTSAFTQVGQTWAGIGVTSGLTDDQIYVARRVDSSGTQKTFEALVARTGNGQPAFKSCSIAVDGFVVPDSLTTTGDASASCAGGAPPTVFAGSGGGDVSACMNGHNTALRGSIGMQTGELKPGTSGWRFVKVDGNAPIHADVAAGKYQMYTDASINTRVGVTNPTASALGYSAFLTRFKSDIKNPAIIALINGSDQTFGKSGLMAAFPGLPATPDFTGATPVNPWNRLVGGTAIDNCQAPKAPF
jgi:hypothetical protein